MRPFYRLFLALAFTIQAPLLFAQVHAAFTSSTASGCSPLVVNFTDQSTGSPNNYYWDFGNSNTSTQRNPSAAYLNPGRYTVKLIARNASGADSIIKTNYIDVFFPPTAQFAASDTIGCAPKNVTFTDRCIAGSASVTSWTWDFGDGTTSNLQSPQHNYASPGTFGVVLLVKDANGCTDRITKANYEAISSIPVANFTTVNTTFCNLPSVVDFTNTTSGSNNTYVWDFGDGTTSTQKSPSHQYTAYGTYTIKLNVNGPGGCTTSITKTNFITVRSYDVNFTVDHATACVGTPFKFTYQALSGTYIWNWNLDGGRTSTQPNPTVTYTTPGTYSISLIAALNSTCADTMAKTAYITVLPMPVANIIADSTSSCNMPFTVNFTAQPAGLANYSWDFGDSTNANTANPSHTYNTIDSFHVKLVVTDSIAGCTSTTIDSNFIIVNPARVAFKADRTRGCAPITVNFTDMTPVEDSIVSWLWDLGDGTTSTLQNPQHSYADTGKYTITLTAVSRRGCVTVITKNNFIRTGVKPTANFTVAPAVSCAIVPIVFMDHSDLANEWAWTYGDGGTDIQQNPSYHYSDTGIFTIKLIVGNNGCYDTMVKINEVNIHGPIARFTPVKNCADPYTVVFDNSTLGGHEFRWDFGDGRYSTDVSPTHTFTGTANYNVRLFARDTISGCVDSTFAIVHLTKPVPNFIADITSGCKALTTTFTSTSTDAVSYLWDYGDGSRPDTIANPRHIYTNAGQYTVRLTIIDENRCIAQEVKTNFINAYGVKAGFSATPLAGCAPLSVNYRDTSVITLGTIASWKWKLGNNDSSTIQNPSSIYLTPAGYSVTLIVVDNHGCTDSVKKVNYINPTFPKPAFIANNRVVCRGSSVTFTNQSAGSGLSHRWSFGDGDTLIATSPTHTYRDTGYYTVSLRLRDINSCDSTLTKVDYIRVIEPHAAFSIDTNFAVCPPLTVKFTDHSYDTITRWVYYFGDGQTSTIKNPSHIYTSPGTYHPWLIASNYLGCSDTIHLADSIVVKGPSATFNFTQPSVCIPFGITFTASSTNNVSSLIWDYGDGSVTAGGDTTSHQYTRTGTFNPMLIIQDSVGCTQSIPAPRPISANTSHAQFTATSTALCGSGDISFRDQSTAVPALGTCRWDFGDGTSSTVRNPVHRYTAPGYYTVKLVSLSTTGCTDTMIKPAFISIYATSHPAFIASDSAVCLNKPIAFTDQTRSDSALASKTWFFGDGSSSTLQNPTHTYAVAGSFTVRLVTNTVNGCIDTARKTITVYSLPVADAGIDRTICAGDTVRMNATGGTSYQWLPATGLSNATIANPVATITSSTAYALSVIDNHGCQAMDTMNIRVNQLPLVTTSNDTTICPGQTASISAAGGTIYQWTPTTGLSNANIASPTVNTPSNRTYIVQVTDANGCKAIDSVKVSLHVPAIAGASNDTSICIGMSAAIHATGGTLYSWTPTISLNQNNIANPVATPTASTMYVVQVTDSNGCKASDSVRVSLFARALAVASRDTAICAGKSVTLSAAGGTSYVWTPATNLSDDSISNPVATPSTTSSYIVQATDVNGCIAKDTVTIRINALPVVATSNDTSICPDMPARISAAGGTTYLWAPATGLNNANTANPTVNITASTKYNVLVTDVNGCQASDSVIVTLYPRAVATASVDTAICVGGTAQLSATGGTQYQWTPSAGLSNGAIENPVSNTIATRQYTVEVTTADGCKAKDSILVTVNSLPIVQASSDTALCSGNNAQLSVSGGVIYEWTPISGLSSPLIANPVVNTDTTTTYTVNVTDINGCEAKKNIKVTINALPIVDAFSEPSICYGDTLRLHATGGTAYTWMPATGLDNAQSANPLFTADASRMFTVNVIDVNGCKGADSIQVEVKAVPRISLQGDSTLCIGDSMILTGYGDGTLAWSPAATLSCATCSEPVAKPITTTTYLLTITGSNACTAKEQLTVQVKSLPAVNVTGGTLVCAGDKIPLTTTTSNDVVRYIWTPATTLDDATKQSPVATPTANTNYHVTAITQYGCQAEDSVTISVITHVALTVSDNVTVCEGASVTITAAAPMVNGVHPTFIWLPADHVTDLDNNSSVQFLEPTESGVYTVIATQGNCIADTQTIAVNVNALPTVDLGDNQVVFPQQPINLHAATTGTITKYQWSSTEACDTCANLQTTAIKGGEYSVTVFDNNGCEATSLVKIKVLTSCEEDVFVPNTFTPNFDGANDQLFVRGNTITNLKTFRIFDRWGNMVFETKDINQGWNGLYNSQPSTLGVYVYYVEGTCRNGGDFVKQGNITLMR